MKLTLFRTPLPRFEAYSILFVVLQNSCVEEKRPLTSLRRGRLTPVQQFNPIEFKTLYYHYSVLKVSKKPILTIFSTSKNARTALGKNGCSPIDMGSILSSR